MMGLDKMLASMIGLTPDQLQAFIKNLAGAADDAVTQLKTLNENVNVLNAKVDAMSKQIERLSNDRSDNSDNDGPGNSNN